MYLVAYCTIYSVDVCILNIVVYISRTSSSLKLNNRKQYKCLSMEDSGNKLCHSPTNACIIRRFFGLVWFFCKNGILFTDTETLWFGLLWKNLPP